MGQVKIGYLQFLKGNTLEISCLFAREREWPLEWMTEWRSNFGLWVGTTAPLSLSNQVLKYVDREAEEWFGYLFWFHINGLSDNIHPFWLSTHWCIDSSWLAVAPIICGNHIGQSFASSLLSSHLEQMTNLSFCHLLHHTAGRLLMGNSLIFAFNRAPLLLSIKIIAQYFVPFCWFSVGAMFEDFVSSIAADDHCHRLQKCVPLWITCLLF